MEPALSASLYGLDDRSLDRFNYRDSLEYSSLRLIVADDVLFIQG